MARIIWDQSGNPPKYISDQLGISRVQLGEAIHEIKHASNLRALDRVIRYGDGMVTDAHGDVSSATSMTNSESTIRAFATLRFAGEIRMRSLTWLSKDQRRRIERVKYTGLASEVLRLPARPGFGISAQGEKFRATIFPII